MRTLSIPVQFFVLILILLSSVVYGRMSREWHFSEPEPEIQQGSENMAIPLSPGQTHMEYSAYYPRERNSQNSEYEYSRSDDSWGGGSMRFQNGRQLSQYDRTDYPRSTDFYSRQGQGQRTHDYNYRSDRRFGGRSELNDAPGSSYDIYGVHQQTRPEYSSSSNSGSRWPNEDPYYNRGTYQGSGSVGDSRDSYSYTQYPAQSQGQSSYGYGQDERDYRPRQQLPYQPEPVEVSTGVRRYDTNPPRYPTGSSQSYDRPYERPSYS